MASTYTTPRARRAEATEDYVRSMSHVSPDGCWLWTGRLTMQGYAAGIVRREDGSVNAGGHRISYEVFIGPIPLGMVIDHLCHNRSTDCAGGSTCRHRRCVNPDHLDVATPRDNVLRSPVATAALNAAKTHCPAGHEYTPQNTYVSRSRGRQCRACVQNNNRRNYLLRKGA